MPVGVLPIQRPSATSFHAINATRWLRSSLANPEVASVRVIKP